MAAMAQIQDEKAVFTLWIKSVLGQVSFNLCNWNQSFYWNESGISLCEVSFDSVAIGTVVARELIELIPDDSKFITITALTHLPPVRMPHEVKSDEDIDAFVEQHLPVHLHTMSIKSAARFLHIVEQATLHVIEELVNGYTPFMGIIINRGIDAWAQDLANKTGTLYSSTNVQKAIRNIAKAFTEEGLKIGVKPGGNTRNPDFTWDREADIRFAKAVDSLPIYDDKPIWKYVIDFMEGERYRNICLDMLLANKDVSDSISHHLLRDAFTKRKEFFGRNAPREYQPQAFTFFHAAHNLNIPTTSYSTLRAAYQRGKKHISTKSP
jgi:hypothetical protein